MGRGLGGSSLLEPGIFLPENPRDFARWEQQFNLSEWGKTAMEPFMFATNAATKITLDDETVDSPLEGIC